MPELPEVENSRKYLQKTSIGKTIVDIEVKNEKILQGISIEDLIDNLITHKFQKTARRGKYLFIQLNNLIWITVHFGMTGSFKFFENIIDEPRHSRLLITFENKQYLSFDDQRLFGSVGLTMSADNFIAAHKLGEDALEIDINRFTSIISGKHTAIKTVLMNQELIAGIGNEYSDEILFQAAIAPTVKAADLTTAQIRKLHFQINFVLTAATEALEHNRPLPDSFLLHSWRKKRICPRCGSQLKCQKFSGRTGCFCPSCQAA